MRYFKILILIIIGLLQFNYGLAADLVEIDGLKYEYIKYNGPVTGYGEVYLIGYSSSVPVNAMYQQLHRAHLVVVQK